MTVHPADLGARRFFARVQAFDLECPACGRVEQVRPSTGGKPGKAQTYDPGRARWRCRGCQRVYVIGLIAWTAGKAAPIPPADQVPGPRELAQMREEGWGWWIPTLPDPAPAGVEGPPRQTNFAAREGEKEK